MQQASRKIRENNGEKSRGDFFLKKELRIALSRKYNPVERSVMILLWQCMRNASSSSKYTAKKRGEFKPRRETTSGNISNKTRINFNRVKTVDVND